MDRAYGSGPLVAVCGLVGGAGTSTLAYLLARHAALRCGGPVLLAELHDHGGIAELTGGGGEYGLAGLVRAVAAELPIGAPYVVGPAGLRVVAAERPAVDSERPLAAAALERVVSDARAAHDLVVVDLGPISGINVGRLLAEATEVLFVVPATSAASARLARLACAGGLPGRGSGSSALVVVATRLGRPAAVKAFRELAEQHFDRLLLVPHVAALAAGRVDPDDRELESIHALFDVMLRGRR
jgi:MinD-like ATPase involved in chromosome partitioning or flagellar assembly